jgi:inhibitor of KinA sporulation pathway (predicted exonuclease)
MPLRRDAVLVIDIEATCWKDNKNPPGQQSEIIEIGGALLDLTTLEPHSKYSVLIKPVRSTMSAFCTQLTSITPAMLEGGTTFAEGCAAVCEHFDAKSVVWVSWGRYDYRMFREQCEEFGVDYPFSPVHANAKQMFADLHRRRKRVGLARAVTLSGLQMEGTHHRAADDAWNTARVLGVLVGKFGRDIFLPYWMS